MRAATECIEKRPPKNGAMTCDDWMFGRFCSPFCNDQYDFAIDLPTSVWACGASGVWLPPIGWSDCAGSNSSNSDRLQNIRSFSKRMRCSNESSEVNVKEESETGES